MIGIGQVVDINDPDGGERIKVKIYGTDNNINDYNKLSFSYPLLPKMMHVKPKIGEAVLVFFEEDNNTRSQRFYIGPLISQYQFFENQLYGGGATTLISGGPISKSESVVNRVKGALPNDSDIAIKGRKNTDIILTDNDIRIRCGVHILDNQEIKFNTLNPAFIKLKYYPYSLKHDTTEISNTGLVSHKSEIINSVANIVADKINLIGNNGNPFIKIDDTQESLSDENVLKFIDKAHQLPYGDKLCELLVDLINMFKAHSHNYNNLPIVEDPNVKAFNRKYGTTKDQLGKVILSDSVRIN